MALSLIPVLLNWNLADSYEDCLTQRRPYRDEITEKAAGTLHDLYRRIFLGRHGNKRRAGALSPTANHATGRSMPRPFIHDSPALAAFASGAAPKGYLVTRREDVWFIAFDGEEFGPYQSEREAMLFAIDAAHKLGEQGEDTQVLRTDESGEASAVWTYGIDSYPPAPQVAP
jgi:hypothetical protein